VKIRNVAWLVLIGLLVIAQTASALRWPENMSYRVETMGGATLGIEDESTELNLFNHQNAAGMAFLPKLNRMDAGLNYDTDSTKTTTPLQETKTDITNAALVRPGAENRGLVWWLTEDLIARVGIEGMSIVKKDTTTITGGASRTDTLNLAGLGGGGSLVYKTPIGLSVGAGISYLGASGKPDSLDGIYNRIPGGTTSKFQVGASNLNWSVGAGYLLDKLGEDNSLSFGLQLGGSDDQPDLSNPLAFTDPLYMGDYSMTMDVAGQMVMMGMPIEIASKSTVTNTPLAINAEAIYNMGSMLAAGLLVDSKSVNSTIKSETTMGTSTTTQEYKAATQNLLGITPKVTANIPVGPVNLLPGIMFTTWGTGTKEKYSPRSSTTNDTYKSMGITSTQSKLAAGVGVQALEKKLQAALQYESGSSKDDSTPYSSTGTAGTVTTTEMTHSAIRLGAEYQIIPMLAVRLGYALITDVTKDGTTNSSGQLVDKKDNLSRLTVGAGLKLPNGSFFDLLVKLDTYTEDPAPADTTTHNATGVFLGTCTVF